MDERQTKPTIPSNRFVIDKFHIFRNNILFNSFTSSTMHFTSDHRFFLCPTFFLIEHPHLPLAFILYVLSECFCLRIIFLIILLLSCVLFYGSCFLFYLGFFFIFQRFLSVKTEQLFTTISVLTYKKNTSEIPRSELFFQ